LGLSLPFSTISQTFVDYVSQKWFNSAPFWLLDLCTSEAMFQPMPQDGSAGLSVFTKYFIPHNFFITKN